MAEDKELPAREAVRLLNVGLKKAWNDATDRMVEMRKAEGAELAKAEMRKSPPPGFTAKAMGGLTKRLGSPRALKAAWVIYDKALRKAEEEGQQMEMKEKVSGAFAKLKPTKDEEVEKAEGIIAKREETHKAEKDFQPGGRVKHSPAFERKTGRKREGEVVAGDPKGLDKAEHVLVKWDDCEKAEVSKREWLSKAEELCKDCGKGKSLCKCMAKAELCKCGMSKSLCKCMAKQEEKDAPTAQPLADDKPSKKAKNDEGSGGQIDGKKGADLKKAALAPTPTAPKPPKLPGASMPKMGLPKSPPMGAGTANPTVAKADLVPGQSISMKPIASNPIRPAGAHKLTPQRRRGQPNPALLAHLKQLPVEKSEGRYEDVAFMKSEDAAGALKLLETGDTKAVLALLIPRHQPGKHGVRNESPVGTRDSVFKSEGYELSWNKDLGYVGLVFDRQHKRR